ncbi:leucine-rich repeat and IQ domain-containing protein 3 [Bufo gargarizans]|uniref:leucine-rich repeat and IQ domain-containing protein 3 n=1 Tax=Bufo gargarizans TaxID=30331 RepID=UPI001CF34196|nr:leucine-rich repeat and IQ domain-containing protein 3 [Bufo gargarizans]
MEESYLICASESLVLDHGRSLGNRRAAELEKLVILCLSKQLLRQVEVLEACAALRACSLANNYITDITALRNCAQIVTLDLHGNQIQNLPGQEFWRPLKNLKLLYLHDNRIRSVDNVESLSSCPSLAGLTLYDTPLSLQKSYRHIVVNSIWSLKALDKFVVSDEEIIEDWSLQGKFKALSPDLRINMSPVSSKDISLENEMKAVNEIIRKINRVLASCSPVLIVQKWIRGYLARRRMGLISGLEMKRMKLHYRRRGSRENRASPLVKAVVIHNFWDPPSSRRRLPVIKQGQNGNKPVRRVNSTPDLQPVRHITVDLWKLQRDVLQALPEAEIVYDLQNQNQQPPPPPTAEGLQGGKRAKDGKFTAFKQDYSKLQQKSDSEIGLLGTKSIFYESDRSKDVLISNENSAEDIRCSIEQIHWALQAKREAANLKDRPHVRPTRDDRHLIKLLPLCAVDKAYENRENFDTQMKKRNLVMKMQADRKQAKYNIEEFLGGKIKEATDQEEMDSQTLQRQVQGNFLDDANFIEKVKHRHRLFCKQKNAKRSEYLLAKEFNIHHLSVSKTLERHDRMVRSQEKMQEKVRHVQALKEDHERQKEFTRCLQEDRQLALQIESAFQKVTLGSLVLEKANDRLHEARAHVATMKGQRVTAEPMSKVPVIQTVSKGTPLEHGCT